MEALPKKAVVAAACVLVALALLGAYQGWRRSTVEETQTAADGSLLPTTAAVAGAKPASALVEAPSAALNEAQIREIARQEIRATLRGDSASSSESAATTGTTTAPSTTTAATILPKPTISPAPTLQTPAAPAPAESAGQAAPLF